MTLSRRRFLKRAAAAASSLAVPASLPLGGLAASRAETLRVAPSDEVAFGVIGVNGMGFSNLSAFLSATEARCLALCDVDANVLGRRAAEVEERTGQAPRQYRDYRRMLEDAALDFVVIGTPDHWHCLPMVEALEAGKHVYVEKPLANTIEECDIMRRAAEAHPDLVVQLGQWQRSGPHWQQAVDYVQSGALGTVRTAKAWIYGNGRLPQKPDGPVPEGVDYDLWLGPAPERPFNPNRFHFQFRWFWDYAGGLMTDWGVHVIDYALYGLQAGYPNSVAAVGGKLAYPDDAAETPDTLQVVYEFDDFTLLWEQATGISQGPYGRDHGVAFIGDNGTVVIDRGGWEVIVESDRVDGEAVPRIADAPAPVSNEGNDLNRHAQNFIQAMKGDAEPNAGIDVGHKVAVVAHMGNVAYKTGRKLHWDADQSRFDDDEANRLTRATYRSPWTLPSY